MILNSVQIVYDRRWQNLLTRNSNSIDNDDDVKKSYYVSVDTYAARYG